MSRVAVTALVAVALLSAGCGALTDDAVDLAGSLQSPSETVDHDPHDHAVSQPSGRAGCVQSTGVDADGDGYVDQVPCDAETQAAADRWAAGHGGTSDEVAAP